MSYSEHLSPWCIVRHLPKMQHVSVARFQRRGDAEAHLRILRQMMPSTSYAIVFDLSEELLTDAMIDQPSMI